MRSNPPLHRAKHGQKPPWPLAILTLFALTGCPRQAAPPPAYHPGKSAGAERAHNPPTTRPQLTRWDRYEEVHRWPSAHAKPFLSLGHLSARYMAQVIVDPAAREAYLNLVTGSSLPVGTVIAELHQDAQTGHKGPIFAMHKQAAGSWEYLVVDANGGVQKRGQLALCQRCHAEGVADQLFGLPRSVN